MLDRKTFNHNHNQPVFVAAQEAKMVKAALNSACDAYKAVAQALDTLGYDRRQWGKPQANFQTIKASLSDVTLGDIMTWLEHFASEEGPALLKQMTGPALIKARARQLYSVLTPLMTELAHVPSASSSRGDMPMLAKVLAHPRVHSEFEAMYKSLGALGRI